MNHEKTPQFETIHDVVIRSLPRSDEAMNLYRYQDHLLHRVGLVQYRELASEQRLELRMRPRSDELWFLLDGACTFLLQDLRANSPTHESFQRYHSADPTLVLVPFGVAFGVEADRRCQLLRIATHDHSEDDGGELLPWPEQ